MQIRTIDAGFHSKSPRIARNFVGKRFASLRSINHDPPLAAELGNHKFTNYHGQNVFSEDSHSLTGRKNDARLSACLHLAEKGPPMQDQGAELQSAIFSRPRSGGGPASIARSLVSTTCM